MVAHDVAVIVLAKELNLGLTAVPVCLAPPRDYQDWFARAVGFGTTETGRVNSLVANV